MLILIPILAMLALEFIVPDKKNLSAKMLLVILGSGIIFFITLRSLLPTAWIYAESEAVVRVRAQVARLLETKDWNKKPILIFEGSSATEYGINGALLQQLLAKKGISVTVLQFSLPGANHFERLFMLQLFFEALEKKQREELATAPTILFSEVFDAYDQEPLYLFKKEAYSLRTIQWLHPWNALVAWKAVWANALKKENQYSWPLLEHAFLNHFCVGVFSSLQPLNYGKKIKAFCPLSGIKKGFDYQKTEKEFEHALSLPALQADQKIPGAGWSVYYRELYNEFGGVFHTLVFYALPTLEPQRRAYQSAFEDHRPANTIMIAPPSLAWMQKMEHEENWFDGVHPQGAGAILFTEWMAENILQQWPQILETTWK